MPQPTAFHIGFPLFRGLTHLDLSGPHEILSRLPGAHCHLLAHTLEPVTSASGLALMPSLRFANAPPLDMLCVPGGPGHLQAMGDAALLDFLRAQASGCRFVTAVCTGAMVLAAAGLLRGHRATTHWMSLDRLAAFGAIPSPERVVHDRDRITGGGVTAGIDFALTVAAVLQGEAVARAIQLQVQYAPQPPFDSGEPAQAAPALVAAVRRGAAGYAAAMDEADRRALASR